MAHQGTGNPAAMLGLSFSDQEMQQSAAGAVFMPQKRQKLT